MRVFLSGPTAKINLETIETFSFDWLNLILSHFLIFRSKTPPKCLHNNWAVYSTQTIFCFLLDIFTDIIDCTAFGDFFCALLVILANFLQCTSGFEGNNLLEHKSDSLLTILQQR
ncbi:hypothetical protein RRG08_015153 [Elysia crispata]|uniref:Uncharacterized protein n=1 Tax=Elysia crispata TaxID=231223 RepID=A0AAE1B0P4_9GAST|nr:hypothetical protein RRG08_015153 [Elysia crispata]